MNHILMIIFASIWLNATCIQMLDEKDVLGGYLKVQYCDKDVIRIGLKNSNKFLYDYSKEITIAEFNKIIDGYKKTLEWFDKVKEMNIGIEKKIIIVDNNLVLDFRSQKDNSLILTILSGTNSSASNGVFGIDKKDKLVDIISKLEHIRDNGKAEFKKQADAFN